MNKKLFGAVALGLVFVALTAFAWFGPAREISEAERRPLKQFPELSLETVMAQGDKSFMSQFGKFTQDQFPLRDSFRSLKALTHYYVLGQRDNNKIYVTGGQVSELAYPLDGDSVDHALQMFDLVYQLHLQDSGRIFATVVPDKGYYVARDNGYLSLDYEALFGKVEQGMPWAEFVDITGSLSIDDYYRTDTHWRQENLLPVAQLLGEALGVTVEDTFQPETLERPFYGVYYGQAALPMTPDTMVLMKNDVLDGCTVYSYETGKPVATGGIYDMGRYEKPDMYEIYLSGSQSLLRIENPNADTDRELIIFRDSYGSALAPLLVPEYAAVTLIDIRYISPMVLGNYVDFAGKDVLFLYSSLVLNKNLI